MSARSQAITVGPVTAAYPHLFTPNAPRNTNAAEKYNVTCLITTEQYNALIPELQAVAAMEFSNDEMGSQNFDWGIRLCSLKADSYPKAAEMGMFFFNAKAGLEFKPRVVDGNHQDIIDPGLIRDGSQLYLSLTFYTFRSGRNLGIGVGLGPVMYAGDGEPLNTGGVNIASVFAGITVPVVGAAAAPAATPAVPGVPGPAVPGPVTQ